MASGESPDSALGDSVSSDSSDVREIEDKYESSRTTAHGTRDFFDKTDSVLLTPENTPDDATKRLVSLMIDSPDHHIEAQGGDLRLRVERNETGGFVPESGSVSFKIGRDLQDRLEIEANMSASCVLENTSAGEVVGALLDAHCNNCQLTTLLLNTFGSEIIKNPELLKIYAATDVTRQYYKVDAYIVGGHPVMKDEMGRSDFAHPSARRAVFEVADDATGFLRVTPDARVIHLGQDDEMEIEFVVSHDQWSKLQNTDVSHPGISHVDAKRLLAYIRGRLESHLGQPLIEASGSKRDRVQTLLRAHPAVVTATQNLPALVQK